MKISKEKIRCSKKNFLTGHKNYVVVSNSLRVPMVTMRGYPKTIEESKNRIAKWQKEFLSIINK